ncbi:MAG: hypothetical protein GX226_06295 [Dehalococcoidales bacterium]|nr:hypothetical protein [Dehalococcoidales bacterium]
MNCKCYEQRVPIMGMLAAFIFAAQMLNFPVAVISFWLLSAVYF